MMKKIIYFYQKLTSTFWFIPLLIIFTSIGLSLVTLKLDLDYPFKTSGILNLVFSENASSGRTLLATIAGAMIGVAGTVFSITLVVLQLASSQFGPRLLQNFMYKRLNQIVLGQYLATFLYCLIILNSISDIESYAFTPSISILVALILAIFNLVLLIFYIHDVCMSIQPSNILNKLNCQILENLNNLYPEVSHQIDGTQLDATVHVEHLNCVKNITSHDSGYIQYFSLEETLAFAVNNNVILNIVKKPGDYVTKDETIIEVLSNQKAVDLSEVKPEKLLTLDYKKTAFQDLEFGIHQIVEIASKALSPGINDPYTAINCIDNLTAILSNVATHSEPSPYVFDEDNNIRLIVEKNRFKDYLNVAFNQIRQYGANSPAILIKQMKSLNQISLHDIKVQHEEEIMRHADMIFTTAEKNFQIKNDINDLEIIYQTLIKR
jgi:uncharacterized membrane protein